MWFQIRQKKKKDQFLASKIQQEILKRSKKQNEIIENMLVSFHTTLREETLIYS